MQSNGKTSGANDENSGAQRLRSSIEHLHEEVLIFLKGPIYCILSNSYYLSPFSLQLEKMKNENAIFDMGDDVNPDFEDTQKEIMQLRKVR